MFNLSIEKLLIIRNQVNWASAKDHLIIAKQACNTGRSPAGSTTDTSKARPNTINRLQIIRLDT